MKLQRNQEALEYLNKALKIDPNDKEAKEAKEAKKEILSNKN